MTVPVPVFLLGIISLTIPLVSYLIVNLWAWFAYEDRIWKLIKRHKE